MSGDSQTAGDRSMLPTQCWLGGQPDEMMRSVPETKQMRQRPAVESQAAPVSGRSRLKEEARTGQAVRSSGSAQRRTVSAANGTSGCKEPLVVGEESTVPFRLPGAATTNGSVHMVARDQAGCRMLQQKLDEGDPRVISTIFSEVLGHFSELMMDPFGNYLCQKLLELCNFRQLERILDRVSGDLVRVSLNMHGARAVQKLVDTVKVSPYVSRLVSALEGSIATLAKDANGNHVVQRCLDALRPEAQIFIFRALAVNIIDVSSDRQGCRIIQRCVDAAQGEGRLSLIKAICSHTLPLVQDPFGNYVVQYVLSLNDLWVNNAVVASMLGHLGVLSKQKFSSNVVERCLQLCGAEEKKMMIGELCEFVNPGELLRDVYGNYVIQSALSVATEPQLSALLNQIRPSLPLLRTSGQGRRIAQKLEKRYPRLRGDSGNVATSGNGRSKGKADGGASGAGGVSSNGADGCVLRKSSEEAAITARDGGPIRIDDALSAHESAAPMGSRGLEAMAAMDTAMMGMRSAGDGRSVSPSSRCRPWSRCSSTGMMPQGVQIPVCAGSRGGRSAGGLQPR